MTPDQIKAMQDAIAAALATNPDVKSYAGANDPTSILNAYMTGDWSGVTSLTGKPFTDEQQKAAVTAADAALAPAYKAQVANDRATAEEQLQKTQNNFQDSQKADATAFGTDKAAQDKTAADQGVLFSGARAQKLNDLRNTYADREAMARRDAAAAIGSEARGYQYQYGNDAAQSLSDRYNLAGPSNFNATTGGVSRGTLSSAYAPTTYNFQGTAPVAQNAAVQTRAASLLANNANKLTTSGIGSKL